MTDPLAELRPHERKLLGYIARRHGDPSRAEDILQQTLLMVIEQSRKQDHRPARSPTPIAWPTR
jgi:DNA-directed RNA polymerase specialized sigma24 family protein